MGFISVTREKPGAAPERVMTSKRGLIIAALIVGLVFLWTKGTFDNFLWRVHLNYTTCAQNAFGATFCGDQLTQYNKRFGIKP